MIDLTRSFAQQYASRKTIDDILFVGFLLRFALVAYGLIHDSYIQHIKYTDIDYSVFTRGSESILNGTSPFDDEEYRYSPVVATIFIPNTLVTIAFGKLLLISLDIVCAFILFILNIYQGSNRFNSKVYVILWLFNPISIAISTRGSLEPVIALLVLSTLYNIFIGNEIYAGLLYGFAIHLKIYPIIYALSFYIFISQKGILKEQGGHLRYFRLTKSKLKFFTASSLAFLLPSYISYLVYGQRYIDQAYLYHKNRKDLQHNFSIYFVLYRLFPEFQDQIASVAFIPQAIFVIYLALRYTLDFGNNSSTKFKKLNFSLFCQTFSFVSLNKVCTSQYFCWYLIFIPLALGSVKVHMNKFYRLTTLWLLSQGIWLTLAYLYEYQNIEEALYATEFASFIFLVTNLYVLHNVCKYFDQTGELDGSPKKLP